MRILEASDCCIVWSAAACHWRGNWAVASTATGVCENWWTTL